MAPNTNPMAIILAISSGTPSINEVTEKGQGNFGLK
jgi:hypothetical protein